MPQISKRAAEWTRPEYAKQWARELGRGLFIHIAPFEDLKNIKHLNGEICVSSWDQTPSLFARMPTALGALFRGEASHYFPTDAISAVDYSAQHRQTMMSKEQIESLKSVVPGSVDEGWMVPADNTLVGFLVLGPETDDRYAHYLEQAQTLAKLNGVGVISMTGNPKQMEELRLKQDKPLEQVDLPEEQTIEKYKGLPQMKEYAATRISKRAKAKDGEVKTIVIKFVDGNKVRKHKLSKRAAIEQSSSGIGVSTTARLRWREYYSKHGMPNMSIMDNKLLNETMGADAKNAKILHRFRLKDKSVGEFRKSHAFYYLLKYMGGGNYVILTIQPAIKETTPEITKQRLTPEYLEKK